MDIFREKEGTRKAFILRAFSLSLSRGGDPLPLDSNFCYLHFFWARKSQAGSPSPGFGHPVTYVVFYKHATSCYWFRLRTSSGPPNPSPISPGKVHCSQQGFWHLTAQAQQSWRLPARDTLGLCEGSLRRPQLLIDKGKRSLQPSVKLL